MADEPPKTDTKPAMPAVKDGPDYKKTKSFPKVEVDENTLGAVLTEVRAMRLETADKFVVITTRMDQFEERLESIETRGNKHSDGTRQLSQTDAKHDAAIAAILTTQVDHAAQLESIAAKVTKAEADNAAILKAVTGFFENKKVIFVGKVIFGLAMTYAAAKGLHIAP